MKNLSSQVENLFEKCKELIDEEKKAKKNAVHKNTSSTTPKKRTNSTHAKKHEQTETSDIYKRLRPRTTNVHTFAMAAPVAAAPK